MAPNTDNTADARVPLRWFLAGLAALLVSLAASVVLAGTHLRLMEVPGCGEGSPCDEAAASAWGSVPGLDWPVAFVGLAYFAALLAAWIAVRREGASAAMRWVVRLGAAVSALFLAVMIFGGYVCPYCVAAHVGNFGFLFAVEAAPAGGAAVRRAVGWGAVAFIAVSVAELGAYSVVASKAQQAFAESTDEIIETSRKRAEGTPTEADGPGFTGRYRMGPERAPIRLVIFSDYQCPDCRQVELEVRRLLEQRDDVSFSPKHYPFCPDCNPNVRNNHHPNACWAARAAETAGILGGKEAFFEMHHWLFDRGGSFTAPELSRALSSFGFNATEFFEVMQSDEPLELVEADIEEGYSLGLYYTPMIFINGVELRGGHVKGAVTRAVEQLAATDPPPGHPTQDQPVPADEKHLTDWRKSTRRTMPPDEHAWTLGPDDAPAEIVVWGDYQEPYTADCDQLIRSIVASRDDVRYTFRHYPVNPSCNPSSPKSLHPLACRMASAAEAAGRVGGNDAYWAIHAWLMENQESYSDERLAEAAREAGLDPDALFSMMDDPDVAHEIAADGRAAMRLDLRGVPFIFIDRRNLRQWRREGVVLNAIEEAAGNGR